MGQDRREDPVGQLAQLGVALLRVRVRLVEQRPRLARRPARRARAARACSVIIVWTRRCWAPSWRSRTTRRRASSAAVSTRARDAVSWSRLSAFAIAVPSSAANLTSAPPRRRAAVAARSQLAVIAPQILPSTVIGAPTVVQTPDAAGELGDDAAALLAVSIRVERPVRSTRDVTLSPVERQAHADLRRRRTPPRGRRRPWPRPRSRRAPGRPGPGEQLGDLDDHARRTARRASPPWRRASPRGAAPPARRRGAAARRGPPR